MAASIGKNRPTLVPKPSEVVRLNQEAEHNFSMSILDKIIEHKRQEIEAHMQEQPLERLVDLAELRAPRGFTATLLQHSPAIIAEIKRGSPSRGAINRSLDPLLAAKGYATNGAACVSILTDVRFFFGSLGFIPVVREQLSLEGVEIPILRKDFIIHPYQVWQSRTIGADAILLIVAALSVEELGNLLRESSRTKLDVLLEIHNAEELEVAAAVLREQASSCKGMRLMLGINNRNLRTFVTDFSTTKDLAKGALELAKELKPSFGEIPLVSESGINTYEDLELLGSYGATAFLVGESLVAEGEPGENLKQLLSEKN